MASEKKFQTIPPFPDELPTIDIAAVPMSGLRSGDAKTSAAVLAACQDVGFFHVDLRNDEVGEKMMEQIDRLFDVSKATFDLPLDTKIKYRIDPTKSMFGSAVSKTETGQLDRYEMINVSQDGIVGNIDLEPLPETLANEHELLKSYSAHCRDTAAYIFRALATQLSLPEDIFTSWHSPTKESRTAVRMLKAFACHGAEDQRTSMIHHTDFGSITLLANLLGGLQVLSPDGDPMDEGAWRWVRPKPGHLIVNLGDVMVEWTGGLLRSNVHRVRYQPRGQEHLDWYSMAVLFRPQSDADMKTKVGQTTGQEINMNVAEYELYKLKLVVAGKWVMRSQGGRCGVALPDKAATVEA